MMQLNFSATTVFKKNYEAMQSDKRHIVNCGSSRSSKTISIIQNLILYAVKNENKTIAIVRKTMPALRATVMKDFFSVLRSCGLYDVKRHNKTNCTYTFESGTEVSFFSVDDSDKLHGRASTITWCNEGVQLFKADYDQINLRCEEKIIIDYNPIVSTSWIYDLAPEECIEIHSTYKDNPFLAPAIKRQIELYQQTDIEMWTVYGLGKRIQSRENVYAGWNFVDNKHDKFQNYVYCIDYGFNHPTSFNKVYYYENELYIEELLYETHLTAADIVNKIDMLNINKDIPIIAEVARPEINQELSQAGYYIISADKRVKEGINAVKTYVVNVSSSSKNIKREYENYRWKKIGDRVTDDVVKILDDSMDAIRYATLYIKKTYGTSTDNFGPQFFSLSY